jgi:pimeloyl-ACP methyl ester carboxylesterase
VTRESSTSAAAGARASASVTATDGVRVAVHLLGGAGPDLMLAHATGFHGRIWRPVADRLASDYRCVAPDLRGHGDSAAPPPQELDWSGLAADLLAAVDGVGLGHPFGVGHSSGATALLLAEQARPGTFGALYCFEPVIVPADPPLGRDRDSWLAEKARGRRAAFASRAEALSHYDARPPLSELDPATLRAYVEHGLEDAPGGGVQLKCTPAHEALVYEMATAHDCFARLGQVRCPVTLVRGGRSEAYRPRLFEQLAGRLHRPASEALADLSHLGPMEDPDAVARSIRRAFAATDERPRTR